VILLCRRPELTCEENGKKDVKQIKPFFSCFSNDCPSLGGWPPLSPPLGHFCAPAPRFFNFPPPRSRRKRTYSAVWIDSSIWLSIQKKYPSTPNETLYYNIDRKKSKITRNIHLSLHYKHCLLTLQPLFKGTDLLPFIKIVSKGIIRSIISQNVRHDSTETFE
jgi:hypothetical protein